MVVLVNAHFSLQQVREQIRTTGQFIQPGIQASQLLYDFGATENRIFATNMEISSTQKQIDATKSQILLEIISAFYEVQRSLLQSRLARKLAIAKNLCKFYKRTKPTWQVVQLTSLGRIKSRWRIKSSRQLLARPQKIPSCLSPIL